ncbi:MAG: hypothetical protein Q9227_004538 [Pyrenula ochraceoflavens]
MEGCSLKCPGDLLKIPQTILENYKSEFKLETETTNELMPLLLSMPNEIIYEIFKLLALSNDNSDSIDINSPACFALTCKHLARIGHNLRVANPLFHGGDEHNEEQIGKMLDLLQNGWNRNKRIAPCQLSRKFALRNYNLYTISNSLPDMDPNKSACTSCKKTAEKITGRAQTLVRSRIRFGKAGASLDTHRFVHTAWDQAARDFYQAEERAGRKIVPIFYRVGR